MGPLVPNIISNQFDLVIALIMGFGFGFALEQAGFSNSKKLVGLFYGYDFVVLKVFFTAGITAMIGVLFLGHVGLLDLSIIYINPTFLRSAIGGGIIMGIGFVVGGFCPGTSVCAASIGKLDGMTFILGSFVGIYIFAEAYPLFENFYLADNMGSPTMNQILGISQVTFAALLSLIAVLAFIGVTIIENKVNKKPVIYSTDKFVKMGLIAVIPFLFIAVTGFTPNKTEKILEYVNNPENYKNCGPHLIDNDKLAFELINNYYKYNIIDVRSPEKFKSFHIPLAVNIPMDSMMNREWEGYVKQSTRTNIFYSDDIMQAKKACMLSGLLGKANHLLLNSPVEDFRKAMFDPVMPPEGSPKDAVNLYYFRLKAGDQLNDLAKSLERFNSKPKVITFKKAKGGCS